MASGILLMLGLYFSIVMYLQPCCKTTLYYSVLSSIFFGIYNIAFVSVTGGLICLIVILNTLLQIYHSSSEERSNKMFRLLIAAFLSIIGTVYLAQTNVDYLPMLAFIIVCLAETSTIQKKIYTLYALSLLVWLSYAYMHSNYMYTSVNSVLLLFNIWALKSDSKDWLVKIWYQRLLHKQV